MGLTASSSARSTSWKGCKAIKPSSPGQGFPAISAAKKQSSRRASGRSSRDSQKGRGEFSSPLAGLNAQLAGNSMAYAIDWPVLWTPHIGAGLDEHKLAPLPPYLFPFA